MACHPSVCCHGSITELIITFTLVQTLPPEAATFISCHQYGNSHSIFEEHNYLFRVYDLIR